MFSRVKIAHVYVFASCVVAVWFCVLLITTYHVAKYINLIGSNLPVPPHLIKKQVLVWGALQDYEAVVDGHGALRCPSVRGQCVVTNDKRQLYQSDVVVASLDGARKDVNQLVSVTRRAPQQLWVAVSSRPPGVISRGRHRWSAMFNLTSTYSWESDFPVPYGRYVSHGEQPGEPQVQYDVPPPSTKRRTVAWFSSTRRTPSGRQAVARQLAKHVTLDVYGRCGGGRTPLKCSKERRSCSDLLRRHYLYYLAFESDVCRDYISEVFWDRALSNGVLPVVLGQRRAAYERFAPPRSFLHVHDFPSVAALANYLKTLAADHPRYTEYLAWRHTGHVALRQVQHDFWCPLCQTLISGTHVTSRHAHDLGTWWSRAQQCSPRALDKKP